MKITAALSKQGEDAPQITQMEQAEPSSGEMRIRIVASGICHTDLNAHSTPLAPKPIVLGHEGSGVVEQLGEGVTGFEVGDHVVLSGNSCGKCPSCLRSKPSYCDMAMPLCFGGQRMDGSTALICEDQDIHSHFFGQSSFASHAIVPQRTAVKMPKDLPLEKLGPLGCGIITGAGGVLEALQVEAENTIAVFGTGAVGLSAIMAAKIAGARKIVAIDLSEERLEMAREFGATDCFYGDEEDLIVKIRSLTGRGMDYTFNTTNVASVHTAAMSVLAMNGASGFVSAPRDEWVPLMFAMLAGGRQMRGILGGDADPQTFLPKLVDYWQMGKFPFDKMLSFYQFEEIEQAFEDARLGKVIKPVLLMEKSSVA